MLSGMIIKNSVIYGTHEICEQMKLFLYQHHQ